MLGKISEETLAKTFEVMLEALSAKCPVKILRDPFFSEKIFQENLLRNTEAFLEKSSQEFLEECLE